LRRYKRFLADVELEGGETLTVHCPNPGRMIGVQEAGAPVLLRDSQNPKRKLRWTLQSIQVGATWVNLDTHLANPTVEQWVRAGEIEELAGYEQLRREVPYGKNSRIDLLLERAGSPPCYVEVKSTTLVEAGLARFPDAVTARGLKHLHELSDVAGAGERAVLFFLVGRHDADRFAPADDIDPAYGRGLREALAAGVELLAYSAVVTPEGMQLQARLPLSLPPLETTTA
jgi:sugar fermentation stimulation protein A